MENEDLNKRKERATDVVNWLIYDRKITYRKDLSKIIGRNASNISQALNGNPEYLTPDFMQDLFNGVNGIIPNINKEWLLNGTGEMFSKSVEPDETSDFKEKYYELLESYKEISDENRDLRNKVNELQEELNSLNDYSTRQSNGITNAEAATVERAG